MNDAFWDKFPKTTKIHCVEMKDRVQARIASETKGLAHDQLFAYFRAASRRFWRDVEHAYPDVTPAPMAVREPDVPGKQS
jgi:hypothetical protein